MASCERRLMLQQQKEISKIRRSAQYYREKIRKYSSHPRHDVPFSSTPEREPSPAPSLNDSQQVHLIVSESNYAILFLDEGR